MESKTHIGARTLLIAGVLALVAGLSTLRAQEPGITYAGYTYHNQKFDLKIDSKASYNGNPVPSGTWSLKDLVPGVDRFFKFFDIKPGDHGENTISLHSNKDVWVCLTFFNLLNGENGRNEPERQVDNTPGTGELTANMEFFAWHDDGDNIFEIGEKPIFGTTTQAANQVLNGKVYALYDYKTGSPLPKNTTKYFGVEWCAGDLQVNVATAQISCNGANLGNIVQTDRMKVDVRLTAVSAKDEPRFVCKSVKPPKPPKPPKDEICEDTPGDIIIDIRNDATIINTSTSVSNTGGNTAIGGNGGSGGNGGPSTSSGSGGRGGNGGSATVVSGSSSASTNTTNIVNTNIIKIKKMFGF